jgi:hypothetical protein
MPGVQRQKGDAMKVTLESTDKIVELVTQAGIVPARLWEGATESGIEVHAYITRIAAPLEKDLAEFDRELQATRNPSAAVEAIPLRLIL